MCLWVGLVAAASVGKRKKTFSCTQVESFPPPPPLVRILGQRVTHEMPSRANFLKAQLPVCRWNCHLVGNATICWSLSLSLHPMNTSRLIEIEKKSRGGPSHPFWERERERKRENRWVSSSTIHLFSFSPTANLSIYPPKKQNLYSPICRFSRIELLSRIESQWHIGKKDWLSHSFGWHQCTGESKVGEMQLQTEREREREMSLCLIVVPRRAKIMN